MIQEFTSCSLVTTCEAHQCGYRCRFQHKSHETLKYNLKPGKSLQISLFVHNLIAVKKVEILIEIIVEKRGREHL